MKMRNTTAPQPKAYIKPLVWGAVSALLTGAAGLLLSALLMTFWDVPGSVITVLSVIAAALGAFVGGFVAARLSKSRGWLMGLLCGGFVFLLIFLTGLLVHGSADIGFLFVKSAVLPFGGMIGGMVGVNRK